VAIAVVSIENKLVLFSVERISSVMDEHYSVVCSAWYCYSMFINKSYRLEKEITEPAGKWNDECYPESDKVIGLEFD